MISNFRAYNLHRLGTAAYCKSISRGFAKRFTIGQTVVLPSGEIGTLVEKLKTGVWNVVLDKSEAGSATQTYKTSQMEHSDEKSSTKASKFNKLKTILSPSNGVLNPSETQKLIEAVIQVEADPTPESFDIPTIAPSKVLNSQNTKINSSNLFLGSY